MERALLVQVTSYGFLHAGMAPLRREVLKRAWSYLPGSTLYGALRAGLIRLEGPTGPGPKAMLEALAAGQLRFTPLLPDNAGAVTDAVGYCRQAQVLAAAEAGRTRDRLFRYQTRPHAPLSRQYGQIEGSLLYAVESHEPEQRYRGYIFCLTGLEPVLERAMGLLPFLPLGGKGKYTAAEMEVLAGQPRQVVENDLAAILSQPEITIELLSPMVVEGEGGDIMRHALRFYPKPLRRYKVWRTGTYPDHKQDGHMHHYGDSVTATEAAIAWLPSEGYVDGAVSQSVAAWPDGSRFVFASTQAPALAAAFVAGLGRRDWAGLGWGQFFVTEPPHPSSTGAPS
jgi:hypothetical protein